MQAESGKGVYPTFAIVVLACALGSLTQTVMNSMLGGIQADFGTDDYVGQWLTTIFMLVIGITVPLVTHLSRRLSIRQLMLLSIGLFAAGAVIDWLAPNFALLFLGRIPQAVATGITLPLVMTIAMTRFPKQRTGTAMGIAGIAMGFAPNIGPLIGGALVDTLGWRSFFIILLVILVVLFIAALIFIACEDIPAHDAHLDIISFVESTLGFGGLLLAFTNAASMPLLDPNVLVAGLLGIVFLVAFIVRQNRIEHPLINMRIFRSASYRASFFAQNCLFASFMGITLIVPLFVMNVGGGTALDAGIVFIPATILAVVFNPLAGILSDRIGARQVVIGGAVLLCIGAISMAFVNDTTPLWLLTCMQTVRGIGVSLLIGPLNSWGMRQLEPQNMVDGSAFFTTVRQACASLGTALMMLVISSVGATALAYDFAFAFSAALSLCVLVCAVWKVR
ncbi:DHA2 family efflux MFS transporter permease subunit [Adlercreutzia sp. ZJ154]|uniref:DHA2 family efflux MFS transporter permease subunit n=1 Tax=Adlercreutzia sp. ZJ154 TaxID=2709790 RepID=UPI0013ECDD4A|nr:DHA2 family efflux MFS transporter permease subunit [Adlercreutzia sp. ZJ154]